MNNLFIIIIFFVISLVIFSIISSKDKKLKTTKFISLLYIIVAGIIIGIGGFLGNKHLLVMSYSTVFYLLNVWMLILGISHVLLLNKLLPWTSEKNFWIGFFFTLVMGLIGGIFLLMVFQDSLLPHLYISLMFPV